MKGRGEQAPGILERRKEAGKEGEKNTGRSLKWEERNSVQNTQSGEGHIIRCCRGERYSKF